MMLPKIEARSATWIPVWLLALASFAPMARAAEHVTLRNGFEFVCTHQETQGARMRLFFASSASRSASEYDQNYLDVLANSVLSIEAVPDPPLAAVQSPSIELKSAPKDLQPTRAELKEIVARAGAQHHIDTDLLASVIHAESNGSLKAVSRTGARGLMQLMPGTASALGVKNAFLAEENVEGGTKYLDQLLTQYHDNIAFALAAYNAGPGAVDRYHGVPPFRETRAYVARVIREFNRRKTILTRTALLVARGE